jgi:carotenoid cleavage dioxygenase-like enzyme
MLAGEDEAASVRIIEVEDGAGGGEVAFVPRDGAEEEDDGYLLLYVHNDYTDESELRYWTALYRFI